MDQDFLTKNPAARLKVPKNLRETDTTTLTWDQLRMALEVMEDDRVLLELDVTDALSPRHPGDGVKGEDPAFRKNEKKSGAPSSTACAGL